MVLVSLSSLTGCLLAGFPIDVAAFIHAHGDAAANLRLTRWGRSQGVERRVICGGCELENGCKNFSAIGLLGVRGRAFGFYLLY